MKVWSCGKYNDIEIGDKVFVGHAGSGTTVFGEYGVLERTTKRHLVFKTESGSTIKTDIENLDRVIGKAGEQHNFVSLNINKDFIPSPLYVF